jgi:hypothetical protein
MKLNVHVLGQHVGVLEQVGDFKSVMAYRPEVAPENLVSLTMPSGPNPIRGMTNSTPSFG